MFKLTISYIALVVIILSVVHDFYTGEITMKGSTFYLSSDLPLFVGFSLFKLGLALGFVAYYRKQACE